MSTRTDVELDALASELEQLEKEATDPIRGFVRNYSFVQVEAMRKGLPSDQNDPASNEIKARANFARIREIEGILNTHHGN